MMRSLQYALGGTLALLGVGLSAPLRSEEADVFSFIPAGGRMLLGELIDGGLPEAERAEIFSGKRSVDEWQDFLQAGKGAIPGLSEFDDYQQRTLAQYLAATMPLSVGTQMTGDALKEALPQDGRDLTLTFCQSCHIITVVVTQERTKEAWLGTMNKPSHIEIALSATGRDALADYLVTNGGIPIEQVPEELRAGGASY